MPEDRCGRGKYGLRGTTREVRFLSAVSAVNGWEGISQASASGNEGKSSPKPTAVNEDRPAYEVRFAISKPCKAVERPLCMIEIPCPRMDTLLTHRARGCRGDASPLRFLTRTFRTIRTIRTIRTRLRQAAPWQATRTAHDRVRVRGNCDFQAVREVFRRFVGAVTRTSPLTVPPVLRQFHPATIPPPSVRSVRSVLTATAPFHRFFGAIPVLRPAVTGLFLLLFF